MTLGLILTALSLGIRHGIDWDHIAAITDLTSAANSRRRGFFLSLLYALGHAVVVVILGVVAIFFGRVLPASLETWIDRFVGVTLIILGVWVVVGLVRDGRDFRLRSRWILVTHGVFAGLRKIRSQQSNRRIVIDHEHASEELSERHDHSGFHTSSSAHSLSTSNRRWKPPWGDSEVHYHRHDVALAKDPFDGSRGRAAAGIGILHGVGIESPSQIALFVAATSVSGTGLAFLLLLIWVLGLILANTVVAGFVLVGFLHAERSFGVYALVACLVATSSVALGLVLSLGLGELPGISP